MACSGFSARAEFGLIGNDDFTVKVSADGSTWYDGLVIDKDDGNIRFFESGNAAELARHMIELFENPERAEALVRNGLAYVERNNWDNKKHEYFALVDGLSSDQNLNVESITRKSDRREPVSV